MEGFLQIPLISTAISVVISWALFAILCSLVHESIVQALSERGRFLKKYLLQQLEDLPNQINWSKLLYNHGPIDLLTRADNKPTSEIPADLFAKSMVEVVGGSHLVAQLIQSQLDKETFMAAEKAKNPNYQPNPIPVNGKIPANTNQNFSQLNPYQPNSVLYNFKSATLLLAPSDVVAVFKQALLDAELKAATLGKEGLALEAHIYQELVLNLTQWYYSFEGRLTTWYGKLTRERLFIIGLILATCLNVDSIALFSFYLGHGEARTNTIAWYEKNKTDLENKYLQFDLKKDEPAHVANSGQPAKPNPASNPNEDSTDDSAGKAKPDTSTGKPLSTYGLKNDSLAKVKILAVTREYASIIDSLTKANAIPVGWETPRFWYSQYSDANHTKPLEEPTATEPKDEKSGLGEKLIEKCYAFLNGFLKVIGFLITAFAASAGSRFWFDLLRKATSVKTGFVK